jgi:hypothetical protein
MFRRTSYSSVSLCLCGLIILESPAVAQDKKDDKSTKPAVKLAVPLAVVAGSTTKVTIRGVRLDEASEVKAASDKAQIKLISKGKATLPNMTDAAAVGETQVEIELTLSEEMTAADLTLVVVTSAGEASLVLPVVPKETLFEDKEANDGFARAQPITAGKVLLGAIEKPKDVDVFRIDLAAGQKLVAEIHAARQGSPLDSIVTLFDSRRQIVATNDDQGGARDSRIEVSVAAPGTYFLSLIDAHDLGSPLHVYRLAIGVE